MELANQSESSSQRPWNGGGGLFKATIVTPLAAQLSGLKIAPSLVDLVRRILAKELGEGCESLLRTLKLEAPKTQLYQVPPPLQEPLEI